MERSGFSKPSKKDISRFQLEVQIGLDYTRKRGEINLIWRPGLLSIVQDQYGHSFHLTEALSIYAMSIRSLSRLTPGNLEGKLPPELILFKPKVDLVDLDEVLGELPAFFYDTFPETQNMPINVFGSERAFREKRALARIRTGNLVEKVS